MTSTSIKQGGGTSTAAVTLPRGILSLAFELEEDAEKLQKNISCTIGDPQADGGWLISVGYSA